jgi:RNA polymerase sigma-70 factor (ECF subfamily)
VARLLTSREGRAFDRLYDRHTAALYGLALRLTAGDQAGAEDVVHDAWIRAVERLSGFRWESSLRTWLSGFVVNGVRQRIRREAREVGGTAALEQEEPAPIGDLARRIDLEVAIARLPDGFRQVLILHDVEGYSHEEIAALLDVVPGTSKSQLARARQALRRSLGTAKED